VKLPNPKMTKSIVKYSMNDIQAIVFKMRHLITMPRDKWTKDETKWWASVNIGLGQLISDIEHNKNK